MNIKDSLVESTILALQGKLNLKESLDVSIQDDGSTVVDTEDATVIVQERQSAEEVVSTETPAESEEVVEVPVESDETIIPEEVAAEETDEPTIDEIVDEPIEEGKQCGNCEEEKEKKEEDISIEVKEDEVEVTTDEEHEVEVKEPEETEEEVNTEETETEEEIPTEIEVSEETEEIDEPIEEGKQCKDCKKDKKTEDIDARPNETALLNYLEGVGTLDGSPAAKLAEDLLGWLSDDDVKRFAETYEYPIFDEVEEAKECEGCKKDTIRERKIKQYKNKMKLNKKITEDYNGDTSVVCFTAKDFIMENGVEKALLFVTDFPKDKDCNKIIGKEIKGYEICDAMQMDDYPYDARDYVEHFLDDEGEDSEYAQPRYISYSEIENLVEGFKKSINKFSSKTFNEALTKFYKGKYKAVESFKTTKLMIKDGNLKLEGKLVNVDGLGRKICLEMKKIQEGKSFTKYELVGSKGLIKESKDNSKLKMVTFLNNNKVLECKYVIKK